MLDCSAEFKARLDREDLSLCRLVTIVLRNGGTYRYTTLDEDVTYKGALYAARPGIEVSTIRHTTDPKQETTTLTVGYYDGLITEEMTRRNALDQATFSITLIDYLTPEITGMVLQVGDVYNVGANNRFYCELSVGSYAGITFQIGEQYSMKCRNVFGDNRCKVDIEKYSREFTVTGVSPNQVELSLSTNLGGGNNDDNTGVEVPGQLDFGPGSHSYTVPEAGVILTIVGTSGSGGAGSYCYRVNVPDPFWENGQTGPILPAWLHGGVDGTDGGDTIVGPMTIKGGKGGKGSMLFGVTGVQVRNQGIANPPVTNATVAELGGGPAGGLSYREINIENIVHQDTRGQDGGRGSKGTLVLVSGVDVQPGDVLNIQVGGAGAGGMAPYGPSTATEDEGQPGHVTITFGANPPVDDNNGEAFDQGSILWLSGRNQGDVAQIAETAGATVTLTAPMSYPIRVGDRGKFRAGCSYYANMCEERYDNLINMEAEPAVPLGIDVPVAGPLTGTVSDPSKPPSQGVDPVNPLTPSFTGAVIRGAA